VCKLLLIADKCAEFGERLFLGEDQRREIGKRCYFQRSHGKLFNKSYRFVRHLIIIVTMFLLLCNTIGIYISISTFRGGFSRRTNCVIELASINISVVMSK